MAPHPKIVATTLTGALAVLVAAVTRHVGDPATIATAVLTVVQAIIGYLTPGKGEARPSPPPPGDPDQDALPHIPTADPATIPPDVGDAGPNGLRVGALLL